MRLMDALFYWLQMRLIVDSRPTDEAARDTMLFFARILSDDHDIVSYDITSRDEHKIYVAYEVRGEEPRTVWFDREAAEQLLREMPEGYGGPVGRVPADEEGENQA